MSHAIFLRFEYLKFGICSSLRFIRSLIYIVLYFQVYYFIVVLVFDNQLIVFQKV